MRLIVCDEGELTGRERAECRAFWDTIWLPDPARAPDPAVEEATFLRVLLYESAAGEGEPPLIGACALEDRAITVAGERRRLAGLGGVAVAEAYRGRDYGTRIVGAAMAEARLRGYGYGVLFCLPDRGPFYAKGGWRRLEGELVVTARGEERRADAGRLVMALPLTPEAEAEWPLWQRAAIHLGLGSW